MAYEVVLVVTRFQVRTWGAVPSFLRASTAAANQAQAWPGFLGGRLLVDRKRVFWTLTMWDSPRSVATYGASEAHARAMPMAARLASEASLARWRQPRQTLPTWQQVHRQMRERAQFVELDAPTSAHLRHEIAVPRRIVERALRPLQAPSAPRPRVYW